MPRATASCGPVKRTVSPSMRISPASAAVAEAVDPEAQVADLTADQRQIVELLKVLTAEPRILILDEATSSLDSESEAMIQAGLNQLMQGRTTFVIAHRLSTIRRADQILVVEQGRIVERGNHAQLFALGGRYYDLYTRQHGLEQNLFLAPGEGDEAVETIG